MIADERLPIGVRRVLNVESGLNDGIATPGRDVLHRVPRRRRSVSSDTTTTTGSARSGELAIGVAVGAGVGARRRTARWASPTGAAGCSTAPDGSPTLALALARLPGGVGGRAATRSSPRSSAGWSSAPRRRADAAESVELTELAGSLLSLVLWFIFGAGFVLPAFEDLDVRIVAVRRRQPHRRADGAGGHRPARLAAQDRATVAVHRLVRPAWAGVGRVRAARRRGARRRPTPRVVAAVDTIAVTIVFSVVAHGVTARPLATRYVEAQRGDRLARGTEPWPGQ